jgi:hypothetical protein
MNPKNPQKNRFDTHLTFAHRDWAHLLQPGDRVIDATCGNGHDTLVLAQLVLRDDLDQILYALDIQEKAIHATRERLAAHLSPSLFKKIKLIHTCHSRFPGELAAASVKLIVYNLGYLPGGNKSITTRTETTLASLLNALTLIQPGGALSITCYPGHSEGKKEEKQIIDWASSLDSREWSCRHHRWLNRLHSPSLLIVGKDA